jgi:predicted nucleic acid-binding protein
MARYPTLHARDAVHVATCETHAIARLVSPDVDFDVVDGLTRIDPTAFA